MEKKSNTKNRGLFACLVVIFAVVVVIISLYRLDVTGRKGSGLGDEFVYDATDLAKVDHSLILYDELPRPFATGFGNSRALAVGPSGQIYIAGDNSVRIFDANGSFIHQIEFAHSPRCLAVVENGNIYIGFKDHIEVYDEQSKQLTKWQSLGPKAMLTSIAVYKDNVFIADAGNRIVLRYDTTGSLVNRIGKKDMTRNIPGFVVPSPSFDLAVGADGLLRIVNPGRHSIEAYTFDGDLEFSWGEFSMNIQGFCGCCNPTSFAILNDDSFVTFEKGLMRAKIYDPAGTFVGVVAGHEQLIKDPAKIIGMTPNQCSTGCFDIAVDANDQILVLDTIKNIVRFFKRKNQING